MSLTIRSRGAIWRRFGGDRFDGVLQAGEIDTYERSSIASLSYSFLMNDFQKCATGVLRFWSMIGQSGHVKLRYTRFKDYQRWHLPPVSNCLSSCPSGLALAFHWLLSRSKSQSTQTQPSSLAIQQTNTSTRSRKTSSQNMATGNSRLFSIHCENATNAVADLR